MVTEKKQEEKTSDNLEKTDLTQKNQFIGFDKEEKKIEKSEKQELKELLEKNLKWSQIIYEQNRRISRRLFLNSILVSLKWIIIFAIIVLGYWYSKPYVKNLIDQYELIKKQTNLIENKIDGNTVDKILNILPLNQSQQEQIKALSN